LTGEILRRIQSTRPDVELVNPEVRGPIFADSIGRWRTELTRVEVGLVHERAGALLAELGYLAEDTRGGSTTGFISTPRQFEVHG
jgi:hypothetical protein